MKKIRFKIVSFEVYLVNLIYRLQQFLRDHGSKKAILSAWLKLLLLTEKPVTVKPFSKKHLKKDFCSWVSPFIDLQFFGQGRMKE